MDSIQSFGDVPIGNRLLPRQVVIRGELLVYIAVVAVCLVLRIAQLDVVPLSTREARQALSAWRTVYPEAAGTPIVVESPLLFAIHSLSFSVLGSSEFSARIMTVIASVLLILSPLLFSQLLGKTRTLIFVLLLAFSPTLVANGRADSPVVWTMLAAMVGLWSLWRYRTTGHSRYALQTTLCAAAMIFLTDPAGLFVLLTLVLAGVFVFWYRRNNVDEDTEIREPIPEGRFSAWPWAAAVPLAVLIVFLISTSFMLYPAGVSNIGELLGSGLRGLTTPQPYFPPFFALLATFFYEPLLVLVGVVAVFSILTAVDVSLEDRFLLGWLIFAVLMSILYAGTGPEHTLWLVLPLAGLSSRIIAELVAGGGRYFAPRWSRWFIAVVVAMLMAMISVHAQSIARSLMTTPDATLQQINLNPQNLIGIVIAVLLIMIGYFLASSEWGEGTAIRGGALGVLAFVMITSLGSGWHISVDNADNAVEFWNRNPTSYQTAQLRQTLIELSKRQTSGFPELAVSALAADDGVVAWLLRDFPNTTFIIDATAAKGQGVVLLPSSIEKPDLGGAYVGHTTAISNGWDFRNISLLNFPAWWLQRRTLTGDLPTDSITIWLRQDIYNGTKPVVPQ
ncbi:MAG: hypothetical protein GC179_07870 [Anaerolineaceae bacterium]|nr:hypothetical protein [Anaerolineaceae bacterium]